VSDPTTPDPMSPELEPTSNRTPESGSLPPPTSEPEPGSLANAGDVESARAAARGDAMGRLNLKDPLPLTIIRTYSGKQQKDANDAFAGEAQLFSALGYTVTSQSWAQGQWGCGAFIVAVLLFLVLIGILVFIYMLFVKPAGTLTVTYTLQAA
jgi:hypothetical protein